MKLQEIAYKDKQLIEQFLRKWTYRPSRGWEPLKNYTINDDGTIDVDDSVVITKDILPSGRLPPYIKFGKVAGTFTWMCEATSFRGSPEECGSFQTEHPSHVSTFKHFPKIVNDELRVYHQGLTSFEGISEHVKHIGKAVLFSEAAIKSGGIGLILTGAPPSKALGWLPQWKIINKYLGNPDSLFDCQMELIDNGLEEFAKL